MLSTTMPPIVMYHSVTSGVCDPYTVRPERFAEQMRWMARRGRKGTSVGELLKAWRNGTDRGLVGLTFDDGYTDFAEHALPILERHGFSATLFAVAGRLGGQSDWDAEYKARPLLTADELRRVADAGIEIGSHGFSHVRLSTVDGDALAREVQESRHILTDVTGQQVRGFCYPFGDFDDRAVSSVEAGYDYGCAVWRTGSAGLYTLPRATIEDSDSPSRLWARRFRYWLRWEVAGRTRADLPEPQGSGNGQSAAN